MKSHCSVCGKEFESSGTLGSAMAAGLAERDGDPERAERIRQQESRRLEREGGGIGICSLGCALKKLLAFGAPPQ